MLFRSISRENERNTPVLLNQSYSIYSTVPLTLVQDLVDALLGIECLAVHYKYEKKERKEALSAAILTSDDLT